MYKKLSPRDVASGKFITAVYNKPTRQSPLGLKWNIVGDWIALVHIIENGLAESQHPKKLRRGMKLSRLTERDHVIRAKRPQTRYPQHSLTHYDSGNRRNSSISGSPHQASF